MKTYKIYGNDEDWYMFPPNWIHLRTYKANSPREAIEKTYQKVKKKGWRLGDLKARLVKGHYDDRRTRTKKK